MQIFQNVTGYLRIIFYFVIILVCCMFDSKIESCIGVYVGGQY